MSREALVIGISKYDEDDKGKPKYFSSLNAPAESAEAIAKILEGPGEFKVRRLPELYNKLENNAYQVNPHKKVSLENLKDAIAELFPVGSQQIPDTALLYFCGHGVVIDDHGIKKGYLASSETDPNKLFTALPLAWLCEHLRASGVQQQIVWIDACHSGMLLNVEDANPSYGGKVRDRCFIASSRDYQNSFTAIGSSYTVFAKALLDGLNPQQFREPRTIRLNNYDLITFLNRALDKERQSFAFTNFGQIIDLIRVSQDTAIASDQPLETIETCPYQGLETFTKETAKYYCGRDSLVNELRNKLDKSDFVPLIGPSGSGKSSLVRAGLLPIIENSLEVLEPIKPSDSDNKPTTTLRTLVLARCELPSDQKKARDLLTSGHFYEAVAALPGKQKFLLIIDQFEELFTLVEPEERRTFIQWVAGPENDAQYREFQNKRQETDRLRIVITMRSDFMDQFQSYRQLNALAGEGKVCLVGPMSQQELRTAIAKPAEKNGYNLEPGLVDLIVGDVDAEQNSLPLLEYALTLLWEKRDKEKHLLTINAYKTLGGDEAKGRLKGALNIKAEEIYKALSEEKHTWAERIFRRLVRTLPGNKDTRQRQRRSDLEHLARTDKDQNAITDVLFAFEKARLLVPDGDYVDLAHEALIEGWKRFATWRQECRDVQRLVERIVDDYNRWQAAPIADQPKFLLPEGVVAQVEAAIAINNYLSDKQEEFVQQSLYIYKPWLNPEFDIETIAIPGGKFKMGSPEGQGYSTEKPEHDVSISAFHLGKYPVTQEQWEAVARSPKVDRELSLTPAYARGDRLPVEQVSWHEAREFCARLSKLKGETYRLPSEAEWEYACRAGQTTAYCFGDDANQLDEYGWYGNNSGDRPLDTDRLWQEVNQDANQYRARLNANANRTHPVGEKKPNAWGLYDMHGNVWEWCEDEWHDNYEDAPDDGSAWTSGSDSGSRLLRGGSWFDLAVYCRSAYRPRYDADVRSFNLGFRVVRVVEVSS